MNNHPIVLGFKDFLADFQKKDGPHDCFSIFVLYFFLAHFLYLCYRHFIGEINYNYNMQLFFILVDTACISLEMLPLVLQANLQLALDCCVATTFKIFGLERFKLLHSANLFIDFHQIFNTGLTQEALHIISWLLSGNNCCRDNTLDILASSLLHQRFNTRGSTHTLLSSGCCCCGNQLNIFSPYSFLLLLRQNQFMDFHQILGK